MAMLRSVRLLHRLSGAQHIRAFAAEAAPEHDNVLQRVLSSQLSDIRAAGTYKSEVELVSPQGPSVRVADVKGEFLTPPATAVLPPMLLSRCAPRVAVSSHRLKFFGLLTREVLISRDYSLPTHTRLLLENGANNYLGLSNHPRLVAAAHRALDDHGFGLSSVRFICGTQDAHRRLEAQLAAFHHQEAAILYPSCFDANAGLFEALLTAEDAVISDQLNHASIIDGIRLCKAQRFRYQHLDMADLEAKLQEASGARVKLIATDGVFSMDGHIAPLKEICALARKHNALVFVDECHATGFMGETGRGTDEHWGLLGQVDIVNSTLGKALGGATGGYTAASQAVVDILRQRSRPYLFSNTVAPAVVGASLEALALLRESTRLRDRLMANTARFRQALTAAGFELKKGSHPIVPIMLFDAALASDMAQKLLLRGIFVVGFSYPVVPKGQARIRVQLSAAHTEAHLQAAVAAFTEVGHELGVIA